MVLSRLTNAQLEELADGVEGAVEHLDSSGALIKYWSDENGKT